MRWERTPPASRCGIMPSSPLCHHPRDNPASRAGLYVHIPFCKKRCPYCDFYSVTDLALKEPFLTALEREMSIRSHTTHNLIFDTLYIGGGTPSLIRPAEVDRIIRLAKAVFRLAAQVEVTLEVNPGTIDSRQLSQYVSAGVNRIHIGVQSFDPRNLELLGRIHGVKDAENALRWSRKAGFKTVGMDLIYGLPDQQKDQWIQDLKRALDFEPEHISCYMLTYEPGTRMTQNRDWGFFTALSQSRSAALFEATHRFLKENGYLAYELSNFARLDADKTVDNRSKHNQKYWHFLPYLGMGPSAHSYVNRTRWWNQPDVRAYVETIQAGRLPVAETEDLTQTQQMIETIYLGLRTAEGVSIRQFDAAFGISFHQVFEKPLEALMGQDAINIFENRCFLTQKGKVLADSITDQLIQALP